MYKVILVDDESLIVEGLKLSIDWEQYGFQVAGCALNGMDALELIRESEPDLVFTDIRMPGISGLELIKKVSETNPRTQFIVVSGYAEFAYAQKALKHGAIGYCLKPFEEDEIINALKKAKLILDKSNHETYEQLLELLDNSSESSKHKILSMLKNAGLDLQGNDGIMLIAFIGQGALYFPENTKYIMLRLAINKKAYLVEKQSNDSLPAFLENQLSLGMNGIGIVNSFNCVEDLKSAINDAIIAAYQFFIKCRKGVFISRPCDVEELDSSLMNLNKAIQQKDTVSIQECFQNMKGLFTTEELSIKNAFKIYNLVTAFLFKSIGADSADIDDFEQLASSYENVFVLLESLMNLTVKQCGISQSIKYSEIDNVVVKQILDYINDNFNKGITVHMLSEKFFISPNYISFIFKKAVGENFKEYLAKIRMNYACELLKNSSYSIQQIGEKAGYNDYFYFTRIFKSMTGLSPSRYRAEQLQSK